MSRMLNISVVIPHLNQQEQLLACLTSLMEARRLPDEIVVVDNGSRNVPFEICAQFSQVKLICELEPGPGPARNLGISNTTGEILAFIDADCLGDHNWLHAAEQKLQENTFDILGGDVRIALHDPKRLTLLEAYESVFAYRMDRYISREGFTGTGNLVVRRCVIDTVGNFAGLSVAEDREWGQRATRAGYTIQYTPEMKVYHPARQTFKELFQKWDRHMAHDFSSVADSPINKTRWLFKTLIIGLSPFAELPKIIFSDRIDGFRSRTFALIALFKIRLYRSWRMAQLLAGLDPAQLSNKWNRPEDPL